MHANAIPYALALTFGAFILAVIAVAGIKAKNETTTYYELCESAGGKPIMLREELLCLRKESFIKMEQSK
jgi:hypothetical protein